jgi:hypothetical protein
MRIGSKSRGGLGAGYDLVIVLSMRRARGRNFATRRALAQA